MERMVPVADGYQLWVEDRGDPEATPLLLIMGANASGLAWPEALVDQLAERHHVVRYDHRDTGRSTWAFDSRPYSARVLADDAIAVLDALDIERAHVVGMSLGGMLIQLLLLDQPRRLRSATLFSTGAMDTGPTAAADSGAAERDGVELPGADPRLLALWQHLGEERDRDAELTWRVEHWRILNGDVLPFDAGEFRALEERIMTHSDTVRAPVAHALADPSGMDRAHELRHRTTIPAQVIEAPEDPIFRPPHADHLAETIGAARLVAIPGMGHALNSRIIEPLGDAILDFTGTVDASAPG